MSGEDPGNSDPYTDTDSGWDPRSEASFRRFLESMGRAGEGARVLSHDGVLGSLNPATPERSLFNSVCASSPRQLAAALDELTSAYSEAGIRAWTVWVPEADVASAELLSGRGHVLDASPRSMILDLASIPTAPEDPDHTDRADWSVLCGVNDAAYGLAEGTFRAGLGSRPDDGFRAYAVTHNGWTASVLATLDCDGDCYVIGVATLPEARGHGYAGRLLHRALLDARERGLTTSTLQATAAGAPVYTRLGYVDLGPINMWELRSPAPV